MIWALRNERSRLYPPPFGSKRPSSIRPSFPIRPKGTGRTIVPFKRVIVPWYDQKRGDLIFFSPSLLANRVSSARIRHFRQQAFPRRTAFWKTSAMLPVSWRPSPLFPVSFPARTFRRKPSSEPMPVFFSFSFYFFYRVCALPGAEEFRENPFRPFEERRLLTV